MMVRTDEIVLHGSPFMQLIDPALIRAKRRELTVFLLMRQSMRAKPGARERAMNKVSVKNKQSQ